MTPQFCEKCGSLLLKGLCGKCNKKAVKRLNRKLRTIVETIPINVKKAVKRGRKKLKKINTR
jgi:hypothetical protein